MNTKTDAMKKAELEEFMQEEYAKYVGRKRRLASAAEWAKYLDVSPTSLSQWMTGQRLPVGKNVFKLAAKLPGIMDILEYPELVPDVPGTEELVKAYVNLSDQEQEELLDYVRNIKQGNSLLKAHAQA